MVFFPLVLLIFSGFHEVTASAAEKTSCSNLQNSKAIFACALENHPDIRIAEAEVAKANATYEKAAQFENPELSVRSVFGQNLGDDTSDTEANLTMSLPYRGLWFAQKDQGRAQIGTAEAAYAKAKAEVGSKILKTLHRLRQIQIEEQVLVEAIKTFGGLKALFRSRPRLTPEQSVSVGIFEMAEADFRVKEVRLIAEEKAQWLAMKVATGEELLPSDKLLPKSPEKWAKIRYSQERLTENPELKEAIAALSFAESELSIARSESWPELKLGPSWVRSAEGPIASHSMGFNLSVAVPIFSWNGGGRAMGHEAVKSATIKLETVKTNVSEGTKLLYEHYQNAVATLEKIPTRKQIEQRHSSAEGFFSKGLIGGALVVETHREVLEMTQSSHELELEAMEAYWKILALEGRFNEIDAN